MDVGSPGASSGAQIYNGSELKEMAADHFPNDYKDVLYFFVDDGALAYVST